MGERELLRSTDMSSETLPITAICIVADKNKCPPGFTPILKTTDEGADADLWRESAFSIFSRPVRYIAISREVKKTLPQSCSVITDLTVVRESEPVPHGYVAIDYTADSPREKALRKRFLCVKTEPRESCVDAVTEVAVLSKTKATPKDFSRAGEVDGALLVFKAGVIPPAYGLRQTQSERNIQGEAVLRGSSAYPQLPPSSHNSAPSIPVPQTVDAFTIKGAVPSPVRGLDGVDLRLNPRLLALRGGSQTAALPPLPDISALLGGEFNYGFQRERETLST